MITAIAADAFGNLVIATYGDGVYLLMGEEVVKVHVRNGFDGKAITDLYVDDAQIWLTTSAHGIAKYNVVEEQTTWLDESVGLANNHVKTILKDSWNNIWFGTSGGGVSRYSGQQFENYSKNTGLSGSYIYFKVAILHFILEQKELVSLF